jgi:hypothetical protein
MAYPAMSDSQKRGGRRGERVPKGYSVGSLQNYDARQNKLYEGMYDAVNPESYTARLAGGDQSMFEQMEAPAHRQFNQLQGDISSRFSGAGMGSRGGSGFQNQITQGASDFSQDLQARRQELQRQAIMDLQGMKHSLLAERPYDRFLVEDQQEQQTGGGWGGAAGGAVSGAAAGSSIMPGWGTAIGAVIGGAAGYFGGSSGGGSYGGGGGDGSKSKFNRGNAGYSGGRAARNAQPSYQKSNPRSYIGNNTSGPNNLPTFMGR